MSLLQFDLRVMVSEPKLMAKISRIMWDTYAKPDEYLPIGEFSRSKPKADLICGVPYTGIGTVQEIFCTSCTSSMHLVEIIILIFKCSDALSFYRSKSFWTGPVCFGWVQTILDRSKLVSKNLIWTSSKLFVPVQNYLSV